MEFKDKRVVITGASGLVGYPTVIKCLEEGAKEVIAVDIKISNELQQLKSKFPIGCLTLKELDLTYLSNCENLFLTEVDICLHLAGIKGSPSRAAKQPADYLFPMMMFNTNMIKAAHDAKVKWFVYTSSVGVYQPADVMEEDTVWSTMPSKNDWYPGWSKRMGELAIESLQVQHGWNTWTVIRPANIYGVKDNFAPDATVIGANVWKVFNTEGDSIVCWGNGSARRDFVFGDDVAQAVVDVVKKEVNDVINFGCGKAVTIKETIETIVDLYKEYTGKTKTIEWDETKPNGDLLRCLSSDKQEKYGILPITSLRAGLKTVIESYGAQQ
jgi:GDP-L-fucose synthase